MGRNYTCYYHTLNVPKLPFLKGVDCFTVQDISYLLYLNATGKRDKQTAKSLYQSYSRREHPFDKYKNYMEKNNASLPNFIVYENMRIIYFRNKEKNTILRCLQ